MRDRCKQNESTRAKQAVEKLSVWAVVCNHIEPNRDSQGTQATLFELARATRTSQHADRARQGDPRRSAGRPGRPRFPPC